MAGLDPSTVQRTPEARQTFSFCFAFLIQANVRERVSQCKDAHGFQMFLSIEKIDAEGNTVRQHGLKIFMKGMVD